MRIKIDKKKLFNAILYWEEMPENYLSKKDLKALVEVIVRRQKEWIKVIRGNL